VRRWKERTEIPARKFVAWLGIGQSKFHDWKDRYGKRNEHNGWAPRDWWLEDWEKQAIINFSFEYPLEGYRRLAFMMLDRDVVAVSQGYAVDSTDRYRLRLCRLTFASFISVCCGTGAT
jgi:putative transposase